MDQSINQSINRSISQSVNQSINQSANQSINQSTKDRRNKSDTQKQQIKMTAMSQVQEYDANKNN